MGFVPLPPPRVLGKYDPPGNIPLYTHLLAQGFHPGGKPFRCKQCGATDDRLKCGYCRSPKPEAYADLEAERRRG
jgi:hypothetical protein